MTLFNSIPGSIMGFVMVYALVDRVCRCIEMRREHEKVMKIVESALEKAKNPKITALFKEKEEG